MADDDKTEPGGWAVQDADKLAEGLNKEVLGLRVEQFERILNGQVAPATGLHAALVGVCLLTWAAAPITPMAWAGIALGLAVLGAPWPDRPYRRGGMLGGAAVFAAAALLGAHAPAPYAAVGLGLIFAVLAGLLAMRKSTPHEFLFAPIYVAVLIELSADRSQDWLLFTPVLAIGVAVALFDRRARAAFGALAGFFVVLCNHWGLSVGAGLGSLVAVGALFLYAIRSTRAGNSDLVNFTIQGVACALLIAIVELFLGSRPLPWIWPASVAVFFAFVRLAHRGMAVRTALAWVILMGVATAWSQGRDAGFLSSTQDGGLFAIASLTSLAAAAGCRMVGQRFHSAFVANVGLFVCVLLAVLATLMVYSILGPAEMGATASKLLRAQGYMMVWALAASISALFVTAVLYAPVSRAEQTPWWRGLVPESWVPFAAGTLNASRKWFAGVPVLGWALTLGAKMLGSLRYLKRDGDSLRFADLAMLIVTGFAAWILSVFIQVAVAGLPAARVPAGDPVVTIGDTAAFGGAAVFLYGFGLLACEPLFLFTASVFTLIPFAEYASRAQQADWRQVGGMAIALGLTLVICAALRSLRRKALETRPAPALA